MAQAQAQDILQPIKVQATGAPDEVFIEVGARVGDGGRYQITGVIAVGGMSTVYRAKDSRIGDECAVKTLFLPTVGDTSETDAFKAEAQIVAGLRFNGIVNVRDYFNDFQFAYLVMDYIDGQNLYDQHRRTGRSGEDIEDLPISPIPEDQVAIYGARLAEALNYLHTRERAIVYRDLKPHNIMRRTSDGAVILLDFGIARRLRGREKRCAADDLGTPGYAAPEQYDAQGQIDGRTDIFSLGVVLCELATGFNPRARSAPRVPPPVQSLRPSLSPTLAAIIQKCLEVDPVNRYQTAGELRAELEKWQSAPSAVRRLQDPDKIWSTRTVGRAACQMHILGDSLFCADSSGTVYAFEIATGKPHARQELPENDQKTPSRFQLSVGGSVSGLPLITLAANKSDSAHLHIYRLGRRSIVPLRKLSTKAGRLMSTISADGQLVVASTDPAELSILTPDARGDWASVHRLKMSSPVVATGIIDSDAVILDARGALCRVGSGGNLIWRNEIASHSAPRVLGCDSQRVVVYGNKDDASVACFDAASGKQMWRTASAGQSLFQGVLCSDSTLAVPTRDAGLAVVSVESGELIERITDFTKPLIGAAVVDGDHGLIALTEYGYGARVVLYDVPRRRISWAVELGEMGAAAPPIVAGDTVIAQDISGAIQAWSLNFRRGAAR